MEVIEQASDLCIHAGDHGGVSFTGIGPWTFGVGAIIGHLGTIAQGAGSLVVGVRHDQGEIQKKRSSSEMRINVFYGFRGKQVTCVCDPVG